MVRTVVTNGVNRSKNQRFEMIEGRVEFLAAGDGHLPQPSDVAAVLGAVKARPEKAGEFRNGRAPAGLDRPCARRRIKSAVGTEESLRRGRTKESPEARDGCSECAPSSKRLVLVE
jgi:hypothetical protein